MVKEQGTDSNTFTCAMLVVKRGRLVLKVYNNYSIGTH